MVDEAVPCDSVLHRKKAVRRCDSEEGKPTYVAGSPSLVIHDNAQSYLKLYAHKG
jgi:hypothetical protein